MAAICSFIILEESHCLVISLTLSTLPFGPISGFLVPFSTAVAGKPAIRVNRAILEKTAYHVFFL